MARRLRTAWQRSRPFPLPQYSASTPTLVGGGSDDFRIPPNAHTLGEAAMSAEAVTFVIGILDLLTPLKEITEQQRHYRWSQEKFGKHLRHADLHTTLSAAAYFIQPRTYLEIGVWRGRSGAVVGAMCPECAIYGFDLWIPDYAGMPNPGPDFVRRELRAVGHRGDVTLISGESSSTLPAFLDQHPELYFDLITIDGDKSVLGAASDFAHALPRLKIGGIVVCDDVPAIFGPTRVWERVIRQDRRYVSWEFADRGTGVAAAIRISD